VSPAPPPPEFLALLNHLDRSVPAGLDIHLVVDNYGTRKHPKVKDLAGAPAALPHSLHPDLRQLTQSGGAPVRPHQQQATRRGSFRSVSQWGGQKIDADVASYNPLHRPFASTATADSIFAKLQRPCKVINGTSH
jgi:putative transposase